MLISERQIKRYVCLSVYTQIHRCTHTHLCMLQLTVEMLQGMGYRSVLQSVPRRHEALGSIPRTQKSKCLEVEQNGQCIRLSDVTDSEAMGLRLL